LKRNKNQSNNRRPETRLRPWVVKEKKHEDKKQKQKGQGPRCVWGPGDGAGVAATAAADGAVDGAADGDMVSGLLLLQDS
jgi:hypothetical protein